ncbi:hypothetical protein Tco_1000411, partial [Tanacetum coccineum]
EQQNAPVVRSQPSVPIQVRGHEKGYMKRGGVEINVGSKTKKVEIPKKRRTITVADNIVEDLNQAVELAISMNAENERKRMKDLRETEIHASIGD